MSKLSEPLKQFINAAHARPNTIPAPKGVVGVYERIAREAGEKKVGLSAWLCASVSSLQRYCSKGDEEWLMMFVGRLQRP